MKEEKESEEEEHNIPLKRGAPVQQGRQRGWSLRVGEERDSESRLRKEALGI